MAEKPIIFSGAMVRALLDGRKTQTRRVLKPQPVKLPDFNRGSLSINVRRSVYQAWNPHCPAVRCPYGQPGDRLWVRETFAYVSPHEYPAPFEECKIEYRADKPEAKRAGGWDCEPDDPEAIRWRPSIHMPRWASRITLEVTGVRVERLQDISEADARAEGAYPPPAGTDDDGAHYDAGTFRDGFRALWESINGAGSWTANPWVWVIEFRRIIP